MAPKIIAQKKTQNILYNYFLHDTGLFIFTYSSLKHKVNSINLEVPRHVISPLLLLNLHFFFAVFLSVLICVSQNKQINRKLIKYEKKNHKTRKRKRIKI